MKKPLLKGMATLVMLFLILLLSTNALADSFAEPKPSKIELENGSKVFYMTPPKYVGDIYPQSGLYYNTEPPEPIYLISSNHSGISYFNGISSSAPILLIETEISSICRPRTLQSAFEIIIFAVFEYFKNVSLNISGADSRTCRKVSASRAGIVEILTV